MRRTEWLQETQKMRFEEACGNYTLCTSYLGGDILYYLIKIDSYNSEVPKFYERTVYKSGYITQ